MLAANSDVPARVIFAARDILHYQLEIPQRKEEERKKECEVVMADWYDCG